MKRSIAALASFVGIIVLVLGLSFYMNPLKLSDNEILEVPAGVNMEIVQTRRYSSNERIEGYFTVRGGNEEVGFWVKDPYGGIINNDIVESRHDFAFTLRYEGVYGFGFTNNQNTTSKTVYLTVQKTLIGGWLSLGLVFVGACLLVVGCWTFLRKDRNK